MAKKKSTMTTMCPLNTVMPQRGKRTMCPMKIKRNRTMCLMMISRWVIVDARRQCESEKEKMKFDRMLEDHKKVLYPNCEEGITNLGTVLEMLKWKADNVVPDKGFEQVLKIFKKNLPKDNELPNTTY